MRNAPLAKIASLSKSGSDSFITCVWDSKPFTIRGDDPSFSKAVTALKASNWDALYLAMNPGENFVVTYQKGNVQIVNGEVLYKKQPIHNTLTQRILASMETGTPCDFLFLFMDKLMLNPSEASRNECYDFLENQHIAITAEGNFIAYKGLRSDYYSIHAGRARVLNGTVDASGRIFNGIGEEIEVCREDVDDDRRNECSNGLHAGTYEYADGFRSKPDGKLVLVEINPKDVVSVPKDYNCGKLRANAYKVLCACEGPITKVMYGEAKTPDTEDVRTQVAGAVASNLSGKSATWTRQKRDKYGRFVK